MVRPNNYRCNRKDRVTRLRSLRDRPRGLRVGLVLTALSAIFAGSFGIAYALGIQSHTVSGVKHGCPFDPGCTGPTNYYGDYNRQGYNLCDPFPSGCGADNDMDSSTVNIYYAPTGGFRAGNSCSNCQRVDANYDTNPAAECYYRTTHSVTGPSLNSHSHYTESAGTPSCPV